MHHRPDSINTRPDGKPQTLAVIVKKIATLILNTYLWRKYLISWQYDCIVRLKRN